MLESRQSGLLRLMGKLQCAFKTRTSARNVAAMHSFDISITVFPLEMQVLANYASAGMHCCKPSYP
jgi:hypothetical protein